MLRWMMDHGFGPAMLLTNAQVKCAPKLSSQHTRPIHLPPEYSFETRRLPDLPTPPRTRQGHSASDLVAALLPKLDKAEMKASGKGAKSALPAAGDKDKDKGKKKKPPKNVLHGCTMEAALSRLGADGVKGMLELSKVRTADRSNDSISLAGM